MIKKVFTGKPQNDNEVKMAANSCKCSCLCVCGQQAKADNTSNKKSNSSTAHDAIKS